MDNTTKLRLTGDAGFIDAGTNHNISAEYITPRLARGWHTVRSFPVGERNCYTLRPLVLPGPKYLVRAMFKYGNYDGLDMLPIFDLHLGVNYWKTVNISDASSPVMEEVIAVVPGGSVQVCLVNTGSGTPFISSLSLRPLTKALYPQANATQGLVVVKRSLGLRRVPRTLGKGLKTAGKAFAECHPRRKPPGVHLFGKQDFAESQNTGTRQRLCREPNSTTRQNKVANG